MTMTLKSLPKASIGFIALSILLAIWSQLGQPDAVREPRLLPFFFSQSTSGFATEIFSGEYWRVLSPVFIHTSIFHLGFNCAAMFLLGSPIEILKGPWLLLTLTLVAGVASNIAEYTLSGPWFGGLSGIIYALFGWLWMQSVFNHTLRVELPRQFVLIMLGWFALCWIGIFGSIANWAHTAGLVTGIMLGFFHAKYDILRVERRVRKMAERR